MFNNLVIEVSEVNIKLKATKGIFSVSGGNLSYLVNEI